MKLTIELSETETQNLLSLLIAGLAKATPPVSVTQSPPAALPAPTPTRKTPSAGERPATPPPATPAPVETAPEERTRSRLSVDESDPLVRSEMKRLSMDGRMPNHKLWDSERNPALPTMAAIILRYKCKGLADLADLMGLEPPLSALSNGRSKAMIEA